MRGIRQLLLQPTIMEQDAVVELKKTLETLFGKEIHDEVTPGEIRILMKSYSNELTDEEVDELIREIPWDGDSAPTFVEILWMFDYKSS